MSTTLTTDEDFDAFLRALASTGSRHEDLSGQRVGSFQLEEKIGEGGMGVVYRATDLALDRNVAIKLLPPERRADTERRARFTREAKSAARLDHENIARIYSIVGDEEHGTAIVMEYIDGDVLHANFPLPPNLALQTARDIASALAAAHAVGLVHRDLKPQNVMRTKDGRIKLLDFGLARPVEGGETITTMEGAIVGTPRYMSPEQARGGAVAATSDVFSFGSVLYEMVGGRPAFKGPSDLAVLDAVRVADPPQLPSETPKELVDVIVACHAKDPAKRPQDGAALVERLSRVSLRVSATGRPRGPITLLAMIALALTAIGAGVSVLLPNVFTTDAPGASFTTTTTQPTQLPLRIGFVGERGPYALWNMRALLSKQVLRTLVFQPVARANTAGGVDLVTLDRLDLAPDGKLLRMRLAKGVRFPPHPRCFPQGRAATVADLDTSFNDKQKYATSSFTKEVVDDELHIRFERPFTSDIAGLVSVMLLPTEMVESDCDDLKDLRHPTGSGPYRVSSHSSSPVMRLTHNAHVDRTSNRPREMSFVPTTGVKDAVARLKSGQLDVLWLRYPWQFEQYNLTSDKTKAALRSVPTNRVDTLSVSFLRVGKTPPFDSAKHRRELVAALDLRTLRLNAFVENAALLPNWTVGGARRALAAPAPVPEKLKRALTDARPLKLYGHQPDGRDLNELRRQLSAMEIPWVMTDSPNAADLIPAYWVVDAPGGDASRALSLLCTNFVLDKEAPTDGPDVCEREVTPQTQTELAAQSRRLQTAILESANLFPFANGAHPFQSGLLVLGPRASLQGQDVVNEYTWMHEIELRR